MKRTFQYDDGGRGACMGIITKQIKTKEIMTDKEIKKHYSRKVWQCFKCKEMFIRVKAPHRCKECGWITFTQVADKLACYALN